MIAVDERRDAAGAIRELLAAHAEGLVDCAMAASSASEMQKDRTFLQNIGCFNQRRTALGFGDLELLRPILRWDFGFWDFGLWADDGMTARERAIFGAMFPGSHFEWNKFARSRRLDPSDLSKANTRRWRNQILDAQAFWAHENAVRDHFVTTDSEFRRLEKKGLVRAGTILNPEKALQLVSR